MRRRLKPRVWCASADSEEAEAEEEEEEEREEEEDADCWWERLPPAAADEEGAKAPSEAPHGLGGKAAAALLWGPPP